MTVYCLTSPRFHVAMEKELGFTQVSELHDSQLTDWELTTTRQIGDQWVENTSTAVLKVPSKVIRAEANYILNPAHPDFPRCSIGNPKLFYFEERLLERFMGVMPR